LPRIKGTIGVAAVFSWLREKTPSIMTAEPVATQPPREVFPWPRGTTLTSLDEAVLALPKAILDPEEPIGAVIQGDDDMGINIPDQGEVLYLRLRPGMSVTLARSCQAVVVSEDQNPRRFRISSPPT
jgi:hypothetical protein